MSIQIISMVITSLESILLILLVTCLILFYGVEGGSSLTDLKITRELKRLKTPTVKRIKSLDGDLIDCVDIYKQPAFDHPLLKNHTIQMAPSNYGGKKKSSSKPEDQVWEKSRICPEGTIPILRTRKSDLPRKYSLENSVENKMESAKLYVEHENHGGEANINVWNVQVHPGESSTASMFVGKKDKPDLINAGWVVSSNIFGDNETRLYVYWGSESGGCYNLLCPGFIQTNPNVVLGAKISPVSTYGGEGYFIHVRIHKDNDHDNWWFEHDYEPVGYWPGSLIKNMATVADLIQWGGQVWNSAPGGRHTDTQMGSGHFPKEGYKKAALIRRCVFFLLDEINDPWSFPTRSTKPKCYGVSEIYKEGHQPGHFFFYGGPGGPGCDE